MQELHHNECIYKITREQAQLLYKTQINIDRENAKVKAAEKGSRGYMSMGMQPSEWSKGATFYTSRHWINNIPKPPSF